MELSQSREREIAELQSVIQALQAKVQQMHAGQQDALESLRLRLTKEHDYVRFHAFPTIAMLIRTP